jgi:hypothetical protein
MYDIFHGVDILLNFKFGVFWVVALCSHVEVDRCLLNLFKLFEYGFKLPVYSIAPSNLKSDF